MHVCHNSSIQIFIKIVSWSILYNYRMIKRLYIHGMYCIHTTLIVSTYCNLTHTVTSKKYCTVYELILMEELPNQSNNQEEQPSWAHSYHPIDNDYTHMNKKYYLAWLKEIASSSENTYFSIFQVYVVESWVNGLITRGIKWEKVWELMLNGNSSSYQWTTPTYCTKNKQA